MGTSAGDSRTTLCPGCRRSASEHRTNASSSFSTRNGVRIFWEEPAGAGRGGQTGDMTDYRNGSAAHEQCDSTCAACSSCANAQEPAMRNRLQADRLNQWLMILFLQVLSSSSVIKSPLLPRVCHRATLAIVESPILKSLWFFYWIIPFINKVSFSSDDESCFSVYLRKLFYLLRLFQVPAKASNVSLQKRLQLGQWWRKIPGATLSLKNSDFTLGRWKNSTLKLSGKASHDRFHFFSAAVDNRDAPSYVREAAAFIYLLTGSFQLATVNMVVMEKLINHPDGFNCSRLPGGNQTMV